MVTDAVDLAHEYWLVASWATFKIRVFFEGISISPMSPLGIDAVEFTLQNTLQGHTKPVNFLCISPDKSRLISVGSFSYFLINLPVH